MNGSGRACTVANVSDSPKQDGQATSALKSGQWRMPIYEPGNDAVWDGLGDEWQAVDGIHEGVRVYVLWVREHPGARPTVAGLCLHGERVTREILRSIPVARLENLRGSLDGPQRTRTPADMPPLERHRDDDPEEFSERVAEYYIAFAAQSSKPTKDMAEHSQVPLPTLRGWIREARLRGKLPPGRRGKAG